MTWQRHKGTSTLPPRWTSGRWTIYRTVAGKRLYWELWDTHNPEHQGYHSELARAKRLAEHLSNAATAP